MSIKSILLACAAFVAIIIILALGMLCVLCGFTAPYFDPLTSHREYDAVHQGAEHVTVDVSSGTLSGGDVKILPSSNDTITVKVRIDSGNPRFIDVKTDFTDSEDGLHMDVRTISMTDEMFSLRSSRSVIEIYLPSNATYDIGIKTFSGDIYVCPLEGGSLVIADPLYRQDGKITVDGGNYTLINVDTAEYMANNRGDIRLKYNSTNVYLDIGNGDVEIDARQTEGRLKASAVSGNILVTVPARTGFSLEASTGKGLVRCDIPLETDQSDMAHLKGKTTGYQLQDFAIDLASGDGDITIATK
jgi:DUF4097 and DUF4098 domain-containing protein YvlB